MDQKSVMKTIAIHGDNLETLKLQGDTSLYIASQLQQHKIFWYEAQNLSYCNGKFLADGSYINVNFNGQELQYKKISQTTADLSTVSCIMIRQDPPIDMSYIASTHILSLLAQVQPKIFFLNHPDSVRNYVEKFLPIIISHDETPETLITNSFERIQSFLTEHKKIIIKPIYGFGGHDIITVTEDQEYIISEYLKRSKNMQLIVQKFLPEIYNGDKRIIVCDGEILGVLGRIPDNGDFLTNTGMGGMIVKATLSEKEEMICQQIAAELDKLGIFFAGIDMIGECVTEINITSPGLLTFLHKEYGSESTEKFFRKLNENLT